MLELRKGSREYNVISDYLYGMLSVEKNEKHMDVTGEILPYKVFIKAHINGVPAIIASTATEDTVKGYQKGIDICLSKIEEEMNKIEKYPRWKKKKLTMRHIDLARM